MNEPNKVLLAGDWHGNLKWADAVVRQLPYLLPDESPRTIVHVGDFGIWPGRDGTRYLNELVHTLRDHDARVLFVDGNHEDHRALEQNRREHGVNLRMSPVPIEGYDEVIWLQRGTRWKWHDRWWLAAGGAASVDRALRREGRDWWPEETIGEADHDRITSPGRADVMVCHDAPTSVPMTFGEWPRGWDIADRARADGHRDRLQAIVDEVRPSWLFHGHYHRHHDLKLQTAHGDFMRVIGLDMDDSLAGNYVVLDARTMELEPAAVAP